MEDEVVVVHFNTKPGTTDGRYLRAFVGPDVKGVFILNSTDLAAFKQNPVVGGQTLTVIDRTTGQLTT